MNNKFVYHGSPKNFNIVIPEHICKKHKKKIIYDGNYFIAYIDKIYTLANMGIPQIHTDGTPVRYEINNNIINIYGPDDLETSLKLLYPSGIYLYTFNSKDFKYIYGLEKYEIITDKKVAPIKKVYIENISDMIKKLGGTFIYKENIKKKQ